MSGKLIVFEGIDGVGKTTQIEILKERYPNFTYISNPGGTKLADEARALLKSGNVKDVQEQFFLMESALLDVKKKRIDPVIESGGIVVCDRYWPSLLAYQCLDSKKIFNNFIFSPKLEIFKTKIDILFFLDNEGMNKKDNLDEFEKSIISKYKNIHNNYIFCFNYWKPFNFFVKGLVFCRDRNLFKQKIESKIEFCVFGNRRYQIPCR